MARRRSVQQALLLAWPPAIVERLRDGALALHTRAMIRATERSTDGYVASELLRGRSQAAEQLVRLGLWTRDQAGYRICRYLEVLPSRAELAAIHRARVQAGQRGGDARWSRAPKAEILTKQNDREERRLLWQMDSKCAVGQQGTAPDLISPSSTYVQEISTARETAIAEDQRTKDEALARLRALEARLATTPVRARLRPKEPR